MPAPPPPGPACSPLKPLLPVTKLSACGQKDAGGYDTIRVVLPGRAPAVIVARRQPEPKTENREP